MKKHSEATITVLTFQKLNNNLEINDSDNGIGINLIKKNGFQNVENRIVLLNGTVTFDSSLGKGLKYKLQFRICLKRFWFPMIWMIFIEGFIIHYLNWE